MPIADKDRISKESTVSRYMQINIPGDELDDDFKTHNISLSDTNDKTIIDNTSSSPLQIVVNSLSLSSFLFTDAAPILRSDLYSIEERPVGPIEDPKEPFPTSKLGDYNQMSVLIDRDGHTLLFDYTPGNNRTFLHHPKGSYLNIDNEGNWVFVAQTQFKEDFVETGGNWSKFIKGNDFSIIDGEESKAVGGDKKTNVKSDNYLTIDQDDNLSIGGTQSTNIGEFQNVAIGKDRTTVISRNELLNIKGYKEQNINGIYIVNSRDIILFNAPIIEFRTNNLVTTNQGSLKETVGGERRIEANQISFSSANDINMNAGAGLTTTVVGLAEETVQGLSFIPPLNLTSKKTVVQLFNYLLEVWTGNIKLDTGLGAGPLLDLNFLTNSLTLSTFLGEFNISPAGITTIGAALKVDVGGSLTTPSIEPAMLGTAHTLWAKFHTHPTGVGPSGIPLQGNTLQLSLSKKVFIATA